ncbi:hypothetical protein A2U01_0113001, partial [Trifolium medium]|nr:hypothetical protein [Trifolium medium]
PWDDDPPGAVKYCNAASISRSISSSEASCCGGCCWC